MEVEEVNHVPAGRENPVEKVSGNSPKKETQCYLAGNPVGFKVATESP